MLTWLRTISGNFSKKFNQLFVCFCYLFHVNPKTAPVSKCKRDCVKVRAVRSEIPKNLAQWAQCTLRKYLLFSKFPFRKISETYPWTKTDFLSAEFRFLFRKSSLVERKNPKWRKTRYLRNVHWAPTHPSTGGFHPRSVLFSQTELHFDTVNWTRIYPFTIFFV